MKSQYEDHNMRRRLNPHTLNVTVSSGCSQEIDLSHHNDSKIERGPGPQINVTSQRSSRRSNRNEDNKTFESKAATFKPKELCQELRALNSTEQFDGYRGEASFNSHHNNIRPPRGMSNYGGSIDRGSLNNQTLQTQGGFISQTAEHFSRLTNDCSSPYYVRNGRIPSPESNHNEQGDVSPKVEVMSYQELQYNDEQT